MQQTQWFQPGRVLDVGVGGGRMGFLAREYGHLPWQPRARGDRVIVDGIEGHAPYLGALQRAIYDEVIVGEAIETLSRLTDEDTHYDLLIAADILEHFPTSAGIAFIRRCESVAKVVLVVTPSTYFDQESLENPLETHYSFWPEHELRRVGATSILHRGASTVCLFGDPTVARAYSTSRGTRWYGWLLPSEIERLLRAARAEILRRHKP